MNQFVVYALIDPRNGRAFYVGATEQGQARVRRHASASSLKLDDRSNSQKSRLIRSLPKRPHPLLPYDFKVLEEFKDPAQMWATEDVWIRRLRSAGEPLLNLAQGGRGNQGGVSPSADTRAKIARAHLGKKDSEETRAAKSAAAKGRVLKFSWLGKKQSTEHVQRRSSAHIGAKRSPETCRRLSEATKKAHAEGRGRWGKKSALTES